MSRKKVIITKLCIALAVLLVIAFFVLRANSEALALSINGIEHKNVRYIVDTNLGNDDTPYKVLQSYTKSGELALVKLEQNQLGFWTVFDINSGYYNGTYSHMAWVDLVGTRRFAATDKPEFLKEYHYVYTGNNAQKLIEIPAEQIPHNTTVNVQQLGEFYLIHMVSLTEPEEHRFNIKDFLQENGYIPS